MRSVLGKELLEGRKQEDKRGYEALATAVPAVGRG